MTLWGKGIKHVRTCKYLVAIIVEIGRIDVEIDERLGCVARLFKALKTLLLGKKEMKSTTTTTSIVLLAHYYHPKCSSLKIYITYSKSLLQ